MTDILVPVSIGEILDKVSILEIKSEKISDSEKLKNIRKELESLRSVCDKNDISYQDNLFSALKTINIELWDIEDHIRLKEKDKAFDDEFIRLARAVYVTNDKRFDAKAAINTHYGSSLREEKSYEDYQ